MQDWCRPSQVVRSVLQPTRREAAERMLVPGSEELDSKPASGPYKAWNFEQFSFSSLGLSLGGVYSAFGTQVQVLSEGWPIHSILPKCQELGRTVGEMVVSPPRLGKVERETDIHQRGTWKSVKWQLWQIQQGRWQPGMRISLEEIGLIREADFSEDVMTELRAQKL